MDFTPSTVQVAVSRADGGVSICSIIVTGRGNILPNGAQWLDEKRGVWARVASDSVIAAEVAQAVPDAVSWKRIAPEQVPQDRTFRDALTPDMTHDMGKAREVVRREIRHDRAKKFVELDAKWMRAQGQGKKAEADAIEAERQKLRDAPADPRIDAAQTIEDLRGML